MQEVRIYTSALCGYCHMAKALLDSKGVAYEEISVDQRPEIRREMERLSRRNTVPQIFIGSRPIGGYDDLADLERRGELDAHLSGSGGTAG